MNTSAETSFIFHDADDLTSDEIHLRRMDC